MPDVVFIDALQIRAVIGVHTWERNVLQDLRIDLALATNTSQAARTDNLVHAIDYTEIANMITELTRASCYQLIEALAEEIAARILRDFDVTRLTVRVTKPNAVANARAVGVIITRPEGPALL